jgi:hypothetical protein
MDWRDVVFVLKVDVRSSVDEDNLASQLTPLTGFVQRSRLAAKKSKETNLVK